MSRKTLQDKDERLIVLVTNDQKELMRKRADAEGLSLSSWARNALVHAVQQP